MSPDYLTGCMLAGDSLRFNEKYNDRFRFSLFVTINPEPACHDFGYHPRIDNSKDDRADRESKGLLNGDLNDRNQKNRKSHTNCYEFEKMLRPRHRSREPCFKIWLGELVYRSKTNEEKERLSEEHVIINFWWFTVSAQVLVESSVSFFRRGLRKSNSFNAWKR